MAKASCSHGSHLSWCSFNLKLKYPPTRRFSPLTTNMVAPRPLLTTDASTVRTKRSAGVGIVTAFGDFRAA